MTIDTGADGSFAFLGGNAWSNDMTISTPNVAVFGNVDLWLANNDTVSQCTPVLRTGVRNRDLPDWGELLFVSGRGAGGGYLLRTSGWSLIIR